MHGRPARGVFVATIASLAAAGVVLTAQTRAVVKIAYFNIQSGKGEPGLPGHPVLFADTTNCVDRSKPMNGWGVGFVQRALTAALADPSIVAVGLTEAWGCGSAEHVRALLGWQARSSERNGVALVARFGMAGPEQWRQLDTSMNPNPADTMWVLRVPVCLDARCTRSLPVYVAHWFSNAVGWQSVLDAHARQSVEFVRTTSGGGPHVFGGDLNVFEGTSTVCEQAPDNTSLSYFRRAGYVDGWVSVRGAAAGFTGMLNRTSCGVPEGAPWKRIDYVWSPPDYLPIAIARFGVVPAGDAAPSDHYGLIATFPMPPARSSDDRAGSTPLANGDIVLYARRATALHGAWTIVDDATAAAGGRVAQVDAGGPKVTSPSASPRNYFELTFTPESGRAYHLWIRGKAQHDSWANDSAYLQFSGSVTSRGAPIYRIGTTSAAIVNLEEDVNAGVAGWGWQDNGYGTNVLGPSIYFDGTPQRVRVQTREDGFSIDQIVLSPVQYATRAPGAARGDTRIVPDR